MDILEINNDNLRLDEIDDIVERVKVFILSHDNFLLASSAGGFQLLGGHVEKSENFSTTIKREILEEAGIKIDDSEISKPFFEVVYFNRNYKGTGRNRLNRIDYFFIKTDKLPKVENMSLTDEEISNNFNVVSLNRNIFQNFLKEQESLVENEKSKLIIREILSAYKKLVSAVKF